MIVRICTTIVLAALLGAVTLAQDYWHIVGDTAIHLQGYRHLHSHLAYLAAGIVSSYKTSS